jgi:hypothetical protein
MSVPNISEASDVPVRLTEIFPGLRSEAELFLDVTQKLHCFNNVVGQLRYALLRSFARDAGGCAPVLFLLGRLLECIPRYHMEGFYNSDIPKFLHMLLALAQGMCTREGRR